MKVEIYRKADICGYPVEEEKPQRTFCGVSAIQITRDCIYGDICGEQLTIKLDHMNYNYYIFEN